MGAAEGGTAPALGYAPEVRVAGAIGEARGYGLRDHLCLAFDAPAEFDRQARLFLAEGLERGCRVLYVGESPPSAAELGGARPGAVRVAPAAATYGAGLVVDPRGQVREYAAAVAEALADGFTGLRVAAQATSLVRTPEQREAFARYEHLIDRYMTRNPFSALCGYDRVSLGADAVAEIACMHPVASPESTPFRLHAGDDALAVGGELDRAGLDLFRLAAARARSADGEAPGSVVLDVSGLDFVDHRGVLLLAELGRGWGGEIVLRNAPYGTRKLIGLLEPEGVRVEAAA